jgi:hypothetical protein
MGEIGGIDRLLARVYYDLKSPAAYAGAEKVFAEARRRDPTITIHDVREYLQKQRVYTMHRLRRRRFDRLRTKASGLHTDWQADLAIFDQLAAKNDGYKYLLVCIDVLSRKLFVAPVRSKSPPDMIEAFDRIWAQNDDIRPHKLGTDRGLEFQAKKMLQYFDQKQIDKRVVYSPDVHASMAERANRTIKERLYRFFSEQNTTRWVDAIQKVVDGINASVNRTTGVAPNSVTFKNARQLHDKLYKGEDEEVVDKRKPLSIGQIVRISGERGIFDKGYLPTFTDELFKIRAITGGSPVTAYKLEDLGGEEILGVFYREELVPTSVDETSHRIAEVLKTRTRKGVKEHFVSWLGYSPQHNSWIRDEDIVRHAP